ncbi:hypothetical protein ODJ79_02410 [Actinoplanes sp. KI2]|uniref:hypothetical protein n=1 Tax=Actinoplanes sp. KI2 TaxID=2983315 RepID=UPI0021D5716E|nr:hypothetical protein [Actinoplanes sp. KI2]MCU7722558.1 hypothetical protein [Actinoplanes sp. KI2]
MRKNRLVSIAIGLAAIATSTLVMAPAASATGVAAGAGPASAPAVSTNHRIASLTGTKPVPGSGAAQAGSVQQRVDAVLAAIPGGRQVSPTKIQYDGLVVTVDPRSDATTRAYAPSDIICSPGWFCIIVRGTTFSFYACKYWDLSNWWGSSPFKNNQTKGTVFRAYDNDYNQVWSNTAYSDGYVDVTPWWHLKPC